MSSPQTRVSGRTAGVLVVHSGDFGAAVAAELACALPSVVSVGAEPGTADPAVWPDAEFVVPATSCPRTDLEQAVDAWALTRRATVVPVSLEHPQLRIGPALNPSTTATLDCLRRRFAQHAPDRALQRQANEAYGGAAGAAVAGAPRGYPHSLAVFAAQWVLAVRQRLDGGDERDLQQVRLLHVHTLQMRSAHLIGCHGNARSPRRGRESERSYADLLPLVQRLGARREVRG
ncbi:hypothetical protein [Streptomyces sp. KR80]|uniref:hypothetical protein n=1 Tax=Streptomyces sp. KR80 TaxID=3457426 RepID=UPI003FD0EC02